MKFQYCPILTLIPVYLLNAQYQVHCVPVVSIKSYYSYTIGYRSRLYEVYDRIILTLQTAHLVEIAQFCLQDKAHSNKRQPAHVK